MDVARDVLRNEGGFPGLFRGMAITNLREIPGNMAMFGTYEALKTYFTTITVPLLSSLNATPDDLSPGLEESI